MRKASLAVAFTLILLSRGLAQAEDPYGEPVIAALRILFKTSKGAMTDGERAAFLVRTAGGSVRCVLWPVTNEYHGATWHGAIPEGTIAVAHTHGVAMPQPSRADVADARRIGLPFLVISRWRIYVVEAEGTVRLLASGRWQQP